MENWICGLSDDLLVRILHRVPTKDAVATVILSKRWRSVWTLLPKLEFIGEESVGWFIEKSLQLHEAPTLRILRVELGPNCAVDVDVCKLVENAMNRRIRVLNFKLLWTAKLTSFPSSLYTCESLVHLTLSNQILVDASSPVCLPSLKFLDLVYVIYKDEDSFSILLSGCPVLKGLMLQRRENDNLKQITVKVPSLLSFIYTTTWDDDHNNDDDDDDDDDDDNTRSLVIDSPALTLLEVTDVWGDYVLIGNMPCLDLAVLGSVYNTNDMFLTSVSSVVNLYLAWKNSVGEGAYCKTVTFPRLAELYFRSDYSENCMEALMFMLQNSPKLQTIIVDTELGGLSPSWNQPSTIPGCLWTHLEYFGWKGYGRREEEKHLVKYILANSACLKTVEISLLATCNVEETQKELESMPRISSSSQLLFCTRDKLEFHEGS